MRRLVPRTFQGRLTGAFLFVVTLTLALVTVLVINRLDDYFTTQQKADLDPKELDRLEAIINSMTAGERRNHAIINGSRRKRIQRNVT